MFCEYCNCSFLGQSSVENDGKNYCDSTCMELDQNQDVPWHPELSLAYEGQQLELKLEEKGGVA